MIDIAEALSVAANHFPKGPEQLAAQMGIAVDYSALSGCAGWCIQLNGVALIRINNCLPQSHQRFTLAHELAHLILGSKPANQPNSEPLASSSGEEKAADQLAAELLVPQSHLKQMISGPPIESSTIRKLARGARVSEIMIACRITGLAQNIGLINAAVICFANNKVKWIWSKTPTIPRAEALGILTKVQSSQRRVYRANYRPGETLVTSLIRSNKDPCLFIQLLPNEIGNKINSEEIAADLERWIFGADNSFRGQVNGCLSSIKSRVREITIDEALQLFNTTYLNRWTGSAGKRIRDPRGQTFLRLRLARWCK